MRESVSPRNSRQHSPDNACQIDVPTHANGVTMRFGFVVLLSTLIAANSAGAQSLTARTDSVMKVAEKEGFGGVVRIEKDGALILRKGYGLAIKKPAVKFTPATVVQIGSNTK